MTRRRRLLIAGVATAALGAGLGIPQAVGGPADGQVSGPRADQAKRAALAVAGEGHVVAVERAEGGTGWQVEVFKPRERLGPWWDETVSGYHVKVRLNRDLEWVQAATGEHGAGEDRTGDE
jgi:hypothetical protein